jgi:DNA-binding MarR family transcriptional regulator
MSTSPQLKIGEQFNPNDYSAQFIILQVVKFGPELLKTSEFMVLLYCVERSIDSDKPRGGIGVSLATYHKALKSLEALGLIEERSGCISVQWPKLREFLSQGRAA